MVNYKRHILKTVTYRIIGTIQTVGISYYISGNLYLSGGLGVIELISKPFIYFFHERIWYVFSNYGVTKNNNKNKIICRKYFGLQDKLGQEKQN